MLRFNVSVEIDAYSIISKKIINLTGFTLVLSVHHKIESKTNVIKDTKIDVKTGVFAGVELNINCYNNTTCENFFYEDKIAVYVNDFDTFVNKINEYSILQAGIFTKPYPEQPKQLIASVDSLITDLKFLTKLASITVINQTN